MDIKELYRDFRNVPRGYKTIPWWIWNGRMEYREIERQLRLMRKAGLDGWMLWARFGLGIEYLSDDFFRRVRFAVEKSAQLKLDVWAFDEYAWPSGTAQNQVPKENPEFRMRVLSCFESRAAGGKRLDFSFLPPVPDGSSLNAGRFFDSVSGQHVLNTGELPSDDRRIEKILAVRTDRGVPRTNTVLDITGSVRRRDSFRFSWEAPSGRWLVMTLISRDYRAYMDALNPEAVACFIRRTHEKYKKWVGKYFRSTFKGFFLDEPRWLRYGLEKPQFPEPTVPWSRNLFQRLEAQGLAEIDRTLAAVFYDTEENEDRSLRTAFWEKMAGLYRESYFGQLADWTAKNGLSYMGDCFSEDMMFVNYGDYFHVTAPLQIPGLDSLCLPRLEFPQVRKAPKFPSSVAHLNGRERCMVEGPGLLGWNATLEHLKFAADRMLCGGVNFFVPNAFFYTVSREQFYEPPSYFFQWTLWPYYPVWDRYVGRLCRLLSRGRHRADAAVLYPTDALLSGYRPLPTATREGDVSKLAERCRALIDENNAVADVLLREQIDFDFIDESAVAAARTEAGRLHIGAEDYRIVIVPSVDRLSDPAAAGLSAFAAGGGVVIAAGSSPEGIPCSFQCAPGPEFRDRLRSFLDRVNGRWIKIDADPQKDYFGVCHRQVGDVHVCFVANLCDRECAATLSLADRGRLELWNPTDGKKERPVFACRDERTVFSRRFAPYDSIVVVLEAGGTGRSLPPRLRAQPRRIALSDEWEFSIADDNVWWPEHLECRSEWVDRRSWEGMARYTFSFPVTLISLPERCALLIDYCGIHWQLGRLKVCGNGQELKLKRNKSLDGELLEADLRPVAGKGTNNVTIEYCYTDYADAGVDLHRKQANPPVVPKLRLLGDFEVVARGLKKAETKHVKSGSWTELGYPFYSGRAVYSQSFRVSSGQARLKWRVCFQSLAAAARITLNGKTVGSLPWRPWILPLGQLNTGRNILVVEVTNTQGNLMYEQPIPSGILGPVFLEEIP